MSTETALSIKTPGKLEFSPEQRQMILNTYCNGAKEDEAAVLLEIASARNLNPLLGQIHFVKRFTRDRGEVWSVQVSIDGFRAIANRTGLYEGQDEPEYIEQNGRLVCCKVKVYRKGVPRPFVSPAYWSEYAQTTKEGKPTQFWANKPHIMLAKCAEASALRKAFPEETSGLYVAEEMGADPVERDVSPAPVSLKEESRPTPEPKKVTRTEGLKAKLAAKTPMEEVEAEIFDAETGELKPKVDGPVVSFGMHKGTAVRGLNSDQLYDILSTGMAKLKSDPKAPWALKLKENLAIINEELSNRPPEGVPTPPDDMVLP